MITFDSLVEFLQVHTQACISIFLNAVTIGAHKSDGLVTMVMIPASSMRLISDSTFGINGNGILRVVVTQ